MYPPPEAGEFDQLRVQLTILERFMRCSDRFMGLTKTEVLHAFYMNSAGEYWEQIKHYNRELNGEFVGAILDAYLQRKRAMYSRALYDIMRILKEAPLAIAPGPIPWREVIAQDYDYYLAGEWDMIFDAGPKYKHLRQIGLLRVTSRAKWLQWYQRGIQYRYNQVRGIVGQPFLKEEKTSMYNRIFEEGVLPVSEHRLIIAAMRRLMYLKFFEMIQAAGVPEIHSPEAWGDKSYSLKTNTHAHARNYCTSYLR